jgi:hypothetical protein
MRRDAVTVTPSLSGSFFPAARPHNANNPQAGFFISCPLIDLAISGRTTKLARQLQRLLVDSP